MSQSGNTSEIDKKNVMRYLATLPGFSDSMVINKKNIVSPPLNESVRDKLFDDKSDRWFCFDATNIDISAICNGDENWALMRSSHNVFTGDILKLFDKNEVRSYK